MSHRNCKSCVHSDGSAFLYILNTAHRRPCPASNGCEVWEADHGQYLKQRRVFSLVPNGSTVQEQDARAMELYRTGMPDNRIAADLGVSARKVTNWRHSNGLPSKQSVRRKLEHDEALALYRQGLSDAEIGQRLGVHKTTVFAWRHRNGYAANRARRAKNENNG